MMAGQLWFVLLAILVSDAASATYPFQNISLPWSARVNDLVSRLTVQEKVRLSN
jgi:hypothetical protein